MKRSMTFGAVASAAAIIMASGALAQVYLGPADWSDPYYRSGPPVARPAGLCEKMCARDFAPCDPIYFKAADGRCSGIPGR